MDMGCYTSAKVSHDAYTCCIGRADPYPAFHSSAVAFKYGVSGPYWYAAGATVQVLLFSMMASKTKLNAPYANTYLQIIRERWGKLLHVVHLCFGLATNILVGSMLILGGSATVNQLTGEFLSCRRASM